MVTRIECSLCLIRIKIEGPASDNPPVLISIECPYCNGANEVEWPEGGHYIVSPDND
jgi:hypothetical protein